MIRSLSQQAVESGSREIAFLCEFERRGRRFGRLDVALKGGHFESNSCRRQPLTADRQLPIIIPGEVPQSSV